MPSDLAQSLIATEDRTIDDPPRLAVPIVGGIPRASLGADEIRFMSILHPHSRGSNA